MKMPKATYEEIRDAMAEVVERCGAEKILAHFEKLSETGVAWKVFWAAAKKENAYLNKFLYGSGLSDRHIETAIKKIAKEIGLVRAK